MKKFSKNYKIDFYQVGADRKLTLYSLMNMIQDIASDHAKLLGFGFDQLDKNTHWVLVRQAITMDLWPRWQDDIRIETYISHADIGTPPRDVLIYFKDELIGRGQTSWLVIDGLTRRVATQKIDLLLEAAVNERCGVKTRKILVKTNELTPLKSFNVEYSDLDMNLHVNNAIYGQWAMNCVELAQWKEWRVGEFYINYLQEILYQSEVLINAKTTQRDNGQEILIEGRVGNNSKAAFTALLLLIRN